MPVRNCNGGHAIGEVEAVIGHFVETLLQSAYFVFQLDEISTHVAQLFFAAELLFAFGFNLVVDIGVLGVLQRVTFELVVVVQQTLEEVFIADKTRYEGFADGNGVSLFSRRILPRGNYISVLKGVGNFLWRVKSLCINLDL